MSCNHAPKRHNDGYSCIHIVYYVQNEENAMSFNYWLQQNLFGAIQ